MTEIVHDSSRRRTDLTGKVFGLWTVVGPGPKQGRHQLWMCRCACGTERNMRSDSLTSGNMQSCGCANGRPYVKKRVIQPGDVFGALTVIERGPRINARRRWLCRCACGTLTNVHGRSLTSGHTKSCGCARGILNGIKKTQHGLSRHPLYGVWVSMLRRCTNQTHKWWKNYGGRGISVCEEWTTDVWAFFAWAVSNGYRPGLTLERVNNNGNYEPANCSWVTRKQQAHNRRPQSPYVRSGTLVFPRNSE